MPEKKPFPIATATIARLCMKQGRLAQAEALFRQLLHDDPHDRRFQDGLAEVLRRNQQFAQTTSSDTISCQDEGGQLICRWSITHGGIQRAEKLLGHAGQLRLRLVPFPLSTGDARWDLPVQQLAGSTAINPPPGAACIAVAIGLLGPEDQFCSIAHTPPVQLV